MIDHQMAEFGTQTSKWTKLLPSPAMSWFHWFQVGHKMTVSSCSPAKRIHQTPSRRFQQCGETRAKLKSKYSHECTCWKSRKDQICSRFPMPEPPLVSWGSCIQWQRSWRQVPRGHVRIFVPCHDILFLHLFTVPMLFDSIWQILHFSRSSSFRQG